LELDSKEKKGCSAVGKVKHESSQGWAFQTLHYYFTIFEGPENKAEMFGGKVLTGTSVNSSPTNRENNL
jgi:hypothetical protein